MQAIDGSLIFQVLSDGSIFGGDYDGRLGPLTDWVNNNAHLFRGKTILDLGSNAGHFPIEYVRAGASRVIAVEGRPEFVDQWRETYPAFPLDLSPVEWLVSDVREISYNRADIVSCLGLLYHIEGFLPRLRYLSESADMVLIEVQTGDEPIRSKTDTPTDRTRSLKNEDIMVYSPDMWERLIHRYFHDEFIVSRIWLTTYGDVYKIRRDGKHAHEFLLTIRAFYLLSRIGTDFNFMIDSRTGCKDITSQPVRVYDGSRELHTEGLEIEPPKP